MTDARPLVLLPPSKGKATGGGAPRLREALAVPHPLGTARREVLAAVTAEVPRLDDRTVARVGGVGGAKVAATRELLAGLADAPTLPAHRRYTGIVHGNAGLADLDPADAAADVRIVSALLGLAALHEPVPDYRLELAASLPGLGGLGPYWRERLADHLVAIGRGRRVWDLLPAEHRRVWDRSSRAALAVVEVSFLRPDGRPANAARVKVAKGRFTAALLAGGDPTPDAVARAVDLGAGWRTTYAGDLVTATYVD